MKTLILKGLGKNKVRRILKSFMVDQFNIFLEYGHEEIYTFPLYCTVYGYGLPEVLEDEPFTVGELVKFVSNKI